MYRPLATILLLCACAVLAAPPKDSNITYVKRQVKSQDLPPDLTYPDQESKIEKLPLTIPGHGEQKSTKRPEKDDTPRYNYSDRIYSIKSRNKKNKTTTESAPVPTQVVEAEATDILPLESVQTDTLVKNDNATVGYVAEVTETTELVTEKYEELTTVVTEVEEPTTLAPRTFPPKLSHYGKSASGSFSQNLIGTTSKRKFRSRCRCERIWNCAKLQISVPRCPDEYFLCCS